MKYCSTCGAKIQAAEAATVKFCGSCGNALNKAFQSVKASAKPASRQADEELGEDDEFNGELPQLDPADVSVVIPGKMTVAQLRNGQAQIEPR